MLLFSAQGNVCFRQRGCKMSVHNSLKRNIFLCFVSFFFCSHIFLIPRVFCSHLASYICVESAAKAIFCLMFSNDATTGSSLCLSFFGGLFLLLCFYLRALKYNWQRCSSIEGRVTCQLWIWPRAQWSWIASGGINGVITNSWRVDVTHSRPWASHAFFVITKQFLAFFFFFWFDVMLLPCTCRTQLFFSHVFKRFSRKRFIICIERGLLTLPIIFDRECRVCVRRYWERKKKKRRGMPIIAYCQENVSISVLFLFCILERWNSKHFFFLFVRFCCLHNLWVASLHGAFTVDKQLTSCLFFF